MNSKRNGCFLIASRFINCLGSGIYNICIPLYLLANTHSVLTTSIFFSIIQIPAIVLLPFLGVWLEKKNLKHGLMLSNVLSVLLFTVLNVFLMTEGFHFYFLLGISFLEKINHSAFHVMSSSIFARLIEKEELVQWNGIHSVFDNIAHLLAPALGAILYAQAGFACAIWLNIVSYVLSIALTALLTYKHNKHIAATKPQPYRLRLKEGFQFILKNKQIFYLFILIMTLNFLVSPTEEVFSPGIMKTVYHFNDSLYGWTASAASAGVILASIILGIKNSKKLSMKTCFYVQAWLMIVTGVCSILLIKISPYGFYALYLALCFLSGYFSTFVNVPLTAQFQLMVDEEYQTRFFSILSFSSNLMIPLGTLFAGLMSDLLRSDVAYLFNGFLMILVLILVFRKLISEKVN